MQKKTIVLLVFVALLLSTALYGINRYGQASILRRQKTELGQQVNFYVEVPGVGNEENSDIGLKVNSQITGDQLEITGFEIAWVDETFIQSAAEYLRDNPEEDDLSGFFNESPLDFGKRVFLPMINKVAIQNETTPQKIKLSKQPEILTAYTGEKAEILEKVFGSQIAYASDEDGEDTDAPAGDGGGDGSCEWYDIGCWMGKAWDSTKDFFRESWDDFNKWWDEFWGDEDKNDWSEEDWQEYEETFGQIGSCTVDTICENGVTFLDCQAAEGSFSSSECPEKDDQEGSCMDPSTDDCYDNIQKDTCETSGGYWRSGSCNPTDEEMFHEKGACIIDDVCNNEVEYLACLLDNGSWQEGTCDNPIGSCVNRNDCSNDIGKRECERDGGTFQIDPCPEDEEKGICWNSGQCYDQVSKSVCEDGSGEFSSSGECPKGACYSTDLDCEKNVTRDYCRKKGDNFFFDSRNLCAEDHDPNQITGACWRGDTCQILLHESVCTAYGGTFKEGEGCPNDPIGACILPINDVYTKNYCVQASQSICDIERGSFLPGQSCPEDEDEQALGSCMDPSTGNCYDNIQKDTCETSGGYWRSGSCSEEEEEDFNDQNDTNWYNWKAYWASQGDMYPGEGQGGDSGYDSYSATTKGSCYLGDDCSRQKKGVCEDMGGLWTAQPLCPGYDTSQQTEKLQRN